MFGAAALNATHALMAALSGVLPGSDGRLPDELRVGATPPSDEELAAWAQLPSGDDQLSHYGAVPIGPGAAEEFYLRTFADTCARRERNRQRLARSREDGAPGERARERLDTTRSRPGSRDDPRFLRAAPAQALPAGAELEIERSEQRAPRADADGCACDPAGRERIREGRRRTAAPRAVGRHAPDLRGLVDRGLPTLATGFGIESECNVHAPNENVPEDAIELGVATMREVFVRLGELGG